MKKRENPFEREMNKVVKIVDMLREEGKSSAECSYLVIVAAELLLIEDSLRFIRTLLSIIIGILIGSLLVG